ncbi:MAG TPA: sialidase family protein, partial [Sandaracinaceae bacterium]
GQTCVDGFCVEDLCFGVTCPPGEDGTRHVCREGSCVPICDTVTCDAPNVCRRTDGACVGNNCIFLPYLCAEGEICVAGECVADPCADVSCGAREFCRHGECVGSCAGVECGPTEVCRGGSCVATGCEAACRAGQVCDAESGECVADPCIGVVCPTGEVCDPAAGGCVDDPCRNITCPGEGEVCRLGECYSASSGLPDGGVAFDAGVEPERVLAAGGFGCAVTPRAGGAGLAWLAILALAALGVRRRRRAAASRAPARLGRSASLAASALALVLASGCEVDPYCLANCGGDGGQDPVEGDSGTSRHDASTPRPDGCAIGTTVDECNEADDDCDGRIDEDVDLTSDFFHCGACGVSCELAGAQTECADGACRFIACFGGFVDLDEDTGGPFEESNGCEYRCFESNGGVEACDTIDNDCDGAIDEGFDLDNDEQNCGRCGQVCTFFRVTNATCVAGTCTFDPSTDCVPGYLDANGTLADGCEYECTPSPSGVEECNGLDDDCDGRTDEDFMTDSDPNNCGRCGRVYSFPNATPRCTAGTCGFDPATDCHPGFSDRDGVQLNGCEYPCTPTADPTEICDGLDNDCDGRVDGATADAGGACNESPSGVATGVCTDTGVLTCVGGALVCVGAPEPSVERCNGLDDDCDGTTDESPVDEGRVCMPAIGTCTAGFTVCRSGSLECERAIGPQPEVCNGLDDDCNGTADDALTDPGIGMPCGSDVGACTSGTLTCSDGRLTCAGSVGPALETCNGIDDDCDGLVDDDPIDVGGSCGSSVGACVPGSEVCMGGVLVCTGGVGPMPEVCDGRDDDCDGSVDEALAQACYTGPAGTRGVGVCADGMQVCVGGTFGACAGQVLPSAETCDGRDEDCDGSVDEGVTRSCYGGPAGTEGVGLCRAGTQACAGGTFGACVGEVRPSAELCDGEDQDCDGAVDEASGGGPLTQTCYSGPAGTAGVGTCRAGTQTCRFGAYDVCAGEVTPRADVCGDGLDTDCDGLGDSAEGCLTAGGELRLDTGTGAGASHSYDVQLAAGGSPLGRNLYAVWVDKSDGSDTADIYFSRSTDGGATWAALTNLTEGTSDRAVRPQIAVGRSGSNDVVYVAYQVVNEDDERRIWVRRSTDSGANFSTPQRLDSTGNTDNFNHSIATSADGQRVVVAWEQLNTSTLARRVVSRASTNGGASWAAERLVSVNVGSAPTAGEPAVTVTSSGRFVFVWREARPPARDTFDVYATYADDATSSIPGSRERRLDGDSGQTRASDDVRVVSAGTAVYVAWVDVSTESGGGADIVFVRST